MKSSTTDLIVIASAKAKPGKEADLEQALREAAGPTRQQPGCVEFRLLRLAGARHTLVGFERWASEAEHQKHLQKHLQGAHVQRLMQRMGDILAEPPNIVAYEVLDE
jgi:quinol monooxygenase YgiN